jgi:glycosyltransferase involved in cell wall biosynthesis
MKNPPQQAGAQAPYEYTTPTKGKLRLMPISDSLWAPTGFGTNTKNVSALLTKDGHHIGYGGCQNPQHVPCDIYWPLGQEEEYYTVENLPIMNPGQEKFGEKSFPTWIDNFKPHVVWTHLDFQMFQHVAAYKSPAQANVPLVDSETGKQLNTKQQREMFKEIYRDMKRRSKWKWAATIPFDGTPCVKSWQALLDEIDYKICMSRYGQIVAKDQFTGCDDTYYIPHGVDAKNTFKPILNPRYGENKLVDLVGDAFVVGCVARNQHRKNIPQLIKGFKEFVDRNELTPKDVRLILHMDWNDAMGWKFPAFAAQYGLEDYLLPPLMGVLDLGQALTEEDMVHLYNCMDAFVLPTAGEGFGIPTIEAMACGVPPLVTNYTTAWEIIREDDPSTADIPLYPLGGEPNNDEKENGRDKLIEEDICEAGILLPYKDMWWDTPARAAPQRAICSSVAIADGLDYLYHNPDKKLKMGKAARAKALKEYDWEPVGQRWIDMAHQWEKDCI